MEIRAPYSVNSRWLYTLFEKNKEEVEKYDIFKKIIFLELVDYINYAEIIVTYTSVNYCRHLSFDMGFLRYMGIKAIGEIAKHADLICS